MRHRLVNALQSVVTRHSPGDWTNPGQAAYHRSSLARCFEEDRGEYPHQFIYPGFSLDGYLADLSEIRTLISAEVSKKFRSALFTDLARMELRAKSLSEGDAAYRQAAPKIDGLPDRTILKKAHAILDLPISEVDTNEECIRAEVVASRMQTALDNYGLDEWVVEVHASMAAKASVNGVRKRLRIRQGLVLSERSVDRLIVHEVGGHVLRWANAEAQPEPLAELSMGRSMLTDEGLALWEETRAGLRDPEMDRLYAARVVAVDAARSHGIVDVVRLIEPTVGLQAATEIAFRVKRGLRDPNSPGGLTKDWAYLGGLVKVEELGETGESTLNILRVTKWSVDHLSLAVSLHHQGSLVEPTFVADVDRLGLRHHPRYQVEA